MSKRKYLKRIKHCINLFHLSDVNHDGEVFHPRVPGDFDNEEDYTMNRVCFSSTISGAYRAITFIDTYKETLYIHVPENLDSIVKRGGLYKPSDKLVWDCHFTGEYWIRRPVKMKCIGKAEFTYKNSVPNFGIWRPRVRFKWIEKYE